MLVLPLNYPEPFAATLGIMLCPGGDESDRRKAKAFAAHHLAEPIRRLYESGRTLSEESLARIAMDGGEELDDLGARLKGGTTTGELFKTYFILSRTHPTLASWSSAIKIKDVVATKRKKSGARSTLWQELRRFRTVAHLWGAWCIREGVFLPRPEVDYDGYDDFQCFLTEAEILRDWGQNWRPRRAKREPPLPSEVWQVPEVWRPPVRRPGWPSTGMIPEMTLPDELVTTLRPAGRPRKAV
jgi:hypothetical protein